MREVIFTEGDFTLVKESGIGVQNTPWEKLSVISERNANKHIIEIRLDPYGSPRFEGKPVKYTYGPDAVEVSHGMRTKKDTLAETEEYIEALKEAVTFARRVQSFINGSDEWRA